MAVETPRAPATPATPRGEAPPPRRHRPYALLVPAAVMLALALWGLGRHDAMGNDEVATRWVSSLGLRSMAHVLHRVDAVHGLYYLIIHFTSMVGDSPTAIRVPSVIAAAVGVFVVGALALRLTGSVLAGTVAGLIAALTPSITFYAQTARSYSMVYLVVALATLALVRALDLERARDGGFAALRAWLPYGALFVVAGYLNELSLLVLAAHLVTLVLTRPRRAALARWLAVSVVAVVLVGPLLIVSRRQTVVLDYLTPPGVRDLSVLWHTYFGASTVVAILLVVVAVVGMLPARRATVVDGSSPVPRSAVVPAAVAVPLVVVPAGLLWLYSLTVRPLYAERYVLFGEIGVALLAGVGIDRLVRLLPRIRVVPRQARWVLPWLPALVACAAVFVFQLDAQHSERTPQSRQFDFGGPASIVGSQARPGDAVLFFDSFYRKARLGYPEDFANTADIALAKSPAAVGNFRGTNLPVPTVRTLILGRERIWVVGREAGTATGPAVRAEAQVLRRHFVRVSLHRFRHIDVTLWQRI